MATNNTAGTQDSSQGIKRSVDSRLMKGKNLRHIMTKTFDETVAEILNKFGTSCSFENLIGEQFGMELDEAKAALYKAIEEDRQEAYRQGSLNELLNVGSSGYVTTQMEPWLKERLNEVNPKE